MAVLPELTRPPKHPHVDGDPVPPTVPPRTAHSPASRRSDSRVTCWEGAVVAIGSDCYAGRLADLSSTGAGLLVADLEHDRTVTGRPASVLVRSDKGTTRYSGVVRWQTRGGVSTRIGLAFAKPTPHGAPRSDTQQK